MRSTRFHLRNIRLGSLFLMSILWLGNLGCPGGGPGGRGAPGPCRQVCGHWVRCPTAPPPRPPAPPPVCLRPCQHLPRCLTPPPIVLEPLPEPICRPLPPVPPMPPLPPLPEPPRPPEPPTFCPPPEPPPRYLPPPEPPPPPAVCLRPCQHRPLCREEIPPPPQVERPRPPGKVLGPAPYVPRPAWTPTPKGKTEGWAPPQLPRRERPRPGWTADKDGRWYPADQWGDGDLYGTDVAP